MNMKGIILRFLISLSATAAPAAFAAQKIEAYTDRKSYVAGDTISFYVSTDSPTYRIEIVRDGLTPQTVASVTDLPGSLQPAAPYGWLGANWPLSHTWVVPAGWTTGSYFARFTTTDATTHSHPFAIRPVTPGSTSRIVFCLDYNTRNAYNFWGGASLYTGFPPAVKVSFQRPFAAENGLGKGAYLPPQCHGRIEAEGYPLEYVTEWDVHQNPSILQAYDIVIWSAHQEYNSRQFYDAIQAHHDRGGHLLFFSANDLWWQIRYEDNGATMVGYKSTAIPNDPMYGVNNALVTTHWYDPLLNRPGESLQGISFLANSGGFFLPENYKVRKASHWIFSGTGVQNGQTLGQTLAGGETDFIGRASPPVVDILLAARRSRPALGQTPPQSFEAVGAIYYEDSPAYGFPNGRGGEVFSAGTQSFCTMFRDNDPDSAIGKRMLRNLLDHMLANPPPRQKSGH